MHRASFSLKPLIRLMIAAELMAIGAATTPVSAQTSISLGSATSVPGGIVTLNLLLATSGGVPPADLQFTLTYPSLDVTGLTVTAGSSATAAGKSIKCSNTATSANCIAYGMNAAGISDGVLATATFNIASGAPDTLVIVLIVSVSASSATGTGIPASGNGGSIALSQPIQPAVSGLSCTPTSVLAPGSAACTVTLTTTAPAGGFSVSLSSDNPNVSVPATVLVPAGASNTSFTATVAAVSTAQTAILKASAPGAFITFSLGLLAPNWKISGASASGAIVTLSGASNTTTTADASGNYTFSGLANGSYTVTPTKSGYTFSPASQSVTVNGANVIAINFTATAQTWSILGGVGTSGSGAIVTLGGASAATATADASGNYTFSGLANGSYTLTPNKSGYKFSPASQSVNVNGASVIAINFTATTQTWSISGGVGTSGSGATVTLSGASAASATADASGNYTFSGLANGTYTITPNQSGYTFIPASRTLSVTGASLTGIIFTVSPPAITIDAKISRDRSKSSSTVVCPTFSTVGGNELLLAFIAAGSRGGTSNITVSGVSGAGLTWVLVARTHVQNGTSEIWRAFAPTPLTSVSVTATLSQIVSTSMTVMSFAGVDASGTYGSGAIGAVGSGNASSGAPGATLFSTRNNSMVIGVGNDAKSAIARKPGAGQSLVHQFLSSAGATDWVQIQSGLAPASGSSITISDLAPTTDPYNLTIVEIRPPLPPAVQTTGVPTAAAPAAEANRTTHRKSPGELGPRVALSNAASGSIGEACSPGGIATLTGRDFTDLDPEKAISFPLPVRLAGVQVKINGVPAPLLFVSKLQINFQCPLLPAGKPLEIVVELENGVSKPPLQTVMQAAAPGLFILDGTRQGLIKIATTDDIAMPKTERIQSRPAQPGESLTIYASGLGEVEQGVPTGTPAPLDRLVLLIGKIKVVVGEIEIDAAFAGLAPGTAGLFQVSAPIPPEAPRGPTVPLYVQIVLPDGTVVISNTVNVAISESTAQTIR